MSKIFRILILSTILLAGKYATADSAVTPIAIAIAPPIQFPSDEFKVTGGRISVLWGRHRYIYGLDLGVLGNITEQGFGGFGISGGFNYTKGQTSAILQIAGLVNANTQTTGIYGLQAALGVNYNEAASKVIGFQIAGLSNMSAFTKVYGVQASIYNHAQEVYGFQIGIVNEVDNLHGLQIGVLNIHHQGLISVSPVINFGF